MVISFGFTYKNCSCYSHKEKVIYVSSLKRQVINVNTQSTCLHNSHILTHIKMFRDYYLSVFCTIHHWLQTSNTSLFFLPFSAPGVMKEELHSVNIKESLSKLTDHSNTKLASQASTILAILGDTS